MFNSSSLNQDAKKSGVWLSFNGGKFLVAHTSNDVFQRTLTRLQQPYRKKIEKGTLDPRTSKHILCESMATGLLVDWKDVGDDTGDIGYSIESATKLLMDCDDLREFVEESSVNLENFRREDIDDTKND